MPWNECNLWMSVSDLWPVCWMARRWRSCAGSSVSPARRVTRFFNRYKDYGIRGLEDRARSPYRHPNKTAFQVEKAILQIKREHKTWGAPKIRDKLIKVFPVIKPPAPSTIHAILDRTRPGQTSCQRTRTRPRVRSSALPEPRMPCGALTTRDSFCWATTGTATH